MGPIAVPRRRADAPADGDGSSRRAKPGRRRRRRRRLRRGRVDGGGGGGGDQVLYAAAWLAGEFAEFLEDGQHQQAGRPPGGGTAIVDR